MYKKWSIEDLHTFKSNFFDNLVNVMKREKCDSFYNFLKISFSEGDETCFFSYGRLSFRFLDTGNNYILIDEKEKTQVEIGYDEKSKFNQFIKNFMLKGNKKLKSVEDTLYEKFKNGNFLQLMDKPYLIYDIETTMGASNQLDTYKFLLAYSMEVDIKVDITSSQASPLEEEGETTNTTKNIKMKYEYIDQDGLADFVQKLVDFDGYIVGYNSIAFDNPVSVLNIGGTQEQIDIINKKSIDLFLFIWNLTGKRIGLNKISESFIGITKTLGSGAEGEGLYQKYLDTGEKKYLEEFKKYCKNDVRMTLMILLYLWYFKKIDIDDTAYTYTLEEFVLLANRKKTLPDELNNQNSSVQKSIF